MKLMLVLILVLGVKGASISTGCTYKENEYEEGEQFQMDGNCDYCTCLEAGNIACQTNVSLLLQPDRVFYYIKTVCIDFIHFKAKKEDFKSKTGKKNDSILLN